MRKIRLRGISLQEENGPLPRSRESWVLAEREMEGSGEGRGGRGLGKRGRREKREWSIECVEKRKWERGGRRELRSSFRSLILLLIKVNPTARGDPEECESVGRGEQRDKRPDREEDRGGEKGFRNWVQREKESEGIGEAEPAESDSTGTTEAQRRDDKAVSEAKKLKHKLKIVVGLRPHRTISIGKIIRVINGKYKRFEVFNSENRQILL